MNVTKELIYILFGGVVALLLLLQYLFHRLRLEDESVFNHLGRPHLISNNNPSNVYRVWRWIYADWRSAALSPATVFLIRALQVLTIAYVLAMIAIIAAAF